MRLRTIGFTENGINICLEIRDRLSDSLDVCVCGIKSERLKNLSEDMILYSDVTEFAKEGFERGEAIVFVGACGIAVRAIVPFVKDKLSDVPVLVIDENKAHVIPILSGHMGGANRLAQSLADVLGAGAVITTATDVRGLFAVDVFAKDNNLFVENREGIKEVSSKLLSGEELSVCIEGDTYLGKLPKELKQIPYEAGKASDILISEDFQRKNAGICLRPKNYVVGIGCKKEKSFEEIEIFFEEVLKQNAIRKEQIGAVASIDVKKDEEGIIQFASFHKIPFYSYSAEELRDLKGEFSSSDFVSDTVGVDNVCERASVKAAGNDAELIIPKNAGNGITIAVAKSKTVVDFAKHNSGDDTDGGKKNYPIHVVGIGPGKEEGMTVEALRILSECDVICGYTVYLELLPERLKNKELVSTPMRQEKERCRIAFEEADKGKKVCMICSGDAGIYGMASLMFEMGEAFPRTEVRIIPGVTAASAGAALLGAPLNHDFCVISLSDLLTPSELIRKRLECAAQGDFNIVIYNPSSHKRKDYLKKACELLLEYYDEDRPCGYVRNIGREDCSISFCTLKELKERETDMFTTVFIGSSNTEFINGKLVTKRGYRVEENTDLRGNN